jgi:hypothetical protein
MEEEIKQHKVDQAFEHELINRRLTWLLTSQSIFFAALAIVLDKKLENDPRIFFINTISALGFFISIFILVAVCMGIRAKYLNYKKFPRTIQWGVNTTVTKIALFPDVLMPVAFAIAWACIWLNSSLFAGFNN